MLLIPHISHTLRVMSFVAACAVVAIHSNTIFVVEEPARWNFLFQHCFCDKRPEQRKMAERSPEACPYDNRPRAHQSGVDQEDQRHMKMVASMPERVKSYFKDKHEGYSDDLKYLIAEQ